jgi:peptidoglycan hydrolase CwlO-like protein
MEHNEMDRYEQDTIDRIKELERRIEELSARIEKQAELFREEDLRARGMK